VKLPLLNRVAGLFRQKADGDPVPGPWYLPITGGWLPEEVGSYWNWWQMGGMPIPQSAQSAIVEACISAYSQTVAICQGDHWRKTSKGGRERVTTSSLSRVLRKPNDYMSISDFMLNMVRQMYLHGNAYALAVRNDRYEIDELHIMNPVQSWPQIATTGDVFYRLGGNHVVNYRLGNDPVIVPMRDVLHFRMHTTRSRWPYPLIGESPLVAAMTDVLTQESILGQQMGFYRNQARPSAVLSTDLVLDKDQVQALRDRWNEQTKLLQSGGTPILTAGLKVQPWSVPGKDASIAEMLKFTEQHIALAFRIPQQVLGLGNAPHSSTEVMMQMWLASGLGFCLSHIESAFDLLFDLKGTPEEYVEFNTDALLRSAYKERIDALARGVQGGIYSPNEAREHEGLDKVAYGDEPRVQQQVVPLSAAAKIPATPAPKPFGGSPAPGKPAPPAPGAPPAAAQPAPKKDYNEDVKRELRNLTSSLARSNARRTTP
jgi:HK97 family phage portal protein